MLTCTPGTTRHTVLMSLGNAPQVSRKLSWFTCVPCFFFVTGSTGEKCRIARMNCAKLIVSFKAASSISDKRDQRWEPLFL